MRYSSRIQNKYLPKTGPIYDPTYADEYPESHCKHPLKALDEYNKQGCCGSIEQVDFYVKPSI